MHVIEGHVKRLINSLCITQCKDTTSDNIIELFKKDLLSSGSINSIDPVRILRIRFNVILKSRFELNSITKTKTNS